MILVDESGADGEERADLDLGGDDLRIDGCRGGIELSLFGVAKLGAGNGLVRFVEEIASKSGVDLVA